MTIETDTQLEELPPENLVEIAETEGTPSVHLLEIKEKMAEIFRLEREKEALQDRLAILEEEVSDLSLDLAGDIIVSRDEGELDESEWADEEVDEDGL